MILVGAMLCCAASLMAQSKPSVAILGDSYSTFKGYVQPDTNAVWYTNAPVFSCLAGAKVVRIFETTKPF